MKLYIVLLSCLAAMTHGYDGRGLLQYYQNRFGHAFPSTMFEQRPFRDQMRIVNIGQTGLPKYYDPSGFQSVTSSQRNMYSNPFMQTPGMFDFMQMNPMTYYEQRAEEEMIASQARTQSAIMAEQYLSQLGSKESCFHESFCEAAVDKNRDSQTAKAAEESIKIMTKMLTFVGKDAKKFIHIQRLIAAYNVGKTTKSPQLCKWLFPCQEQRTETVEARIPCSQTAKLCPGVSISCGLCAILAPEACGAVCPVAAIYCGTAGYACVFEAASAKEEAPEEVPEEVPTKVKVPELPKKKRDQKL